MIGQFIRGVFIPMFVFLLIFFPVSMILEGGRDAATPLLIGLFFIFPFLAIPTYFMLKSAQRNDDPLFRWVFKKEYLGMNLLGDYEQTVKKLVELKKEQEKKKLESEIEELKNESEGDKEAS